MRTASLPLLLLLITACTNQKLSTTAAPDWALLPFVKADSVNPIMGPDATLVFHCPVLERSVRWSEKDVFNPAAIVRHDTVFLLFRAEDTIGRHAGTSRIGLAYSTDGLHFTKHPEPVLYPQNDAWKTLEWEGGCEDPRVVQDEAGTYYMTYTAYDGQKARLLVATSPDLYHWTKHGPVFSGRYADFWSKSGAVVARYDKGGITAQKIGGKYWMYWGDQNIWAATSENLIHWTPVVDSTQQLSDMEQRGIARQAPELKVVFGPRRGKFDSDLVEPGPPALLTDRGIVLLYNSRNIPSLGDTSLAEGTYAVAQILMDRNDPTKVLDRMDRYFLRPDKPYETTGQVNHVCFAEGLVDYKGRWFLYYGTADSKIAVAAGMEE